MGKGKIPVSIELADLENHAQWRERTFCEDKSEARNEVAKKWGLPSWEELVRTLKSRQVPAAPKGKPGRVSFQLCFSRHEMFQALRKAGFDAEPYRRLENRLGEEAEAPVVKPKGKPVADCAYLKSEYPVRVQIQILEYGLPTTLRVQVGDRRYGREIRKALEALAAKDKRNVESERRHTALWGGIESVLAQEGKTLEEVESGKKKLSSKGLTRMIALAKNLELEHRHNLHSACLWVGKADQEGALRWLIEEFKRPRADDQLGVQIWQLAMPAVADDLIALIRTRKYGEERGPICLALAKTRNKRAAEVIAAVLAEKGVTRWAIEALGMLKAKEQATKIRPWLKDKDADVRREAKKTLRKMGMPVEAPPPPVHLVKLRRKLPRHLEEWSAGVELEDIGRILGEAGKLVKGFGKTEIAEVTGVAELMPVEQTRAFRFEVKRRGKPEELWVTLYMDDINSPDLAIFANHEVIAQLEKRVKLE
jgi:hypothetical protein